MKLSELRPDPENVNDHDEGSISAITESLQSFGQQKPIVVTPEGIVIAGNGQLEAARRLGWKSISVAVTTLKGAALKAYAIADNRTGEFSELDAEKLGDALVALRQAEDESGDDSQKLVLAAGFTTEEASQAIAAAEEALASRESPAKTKSGTAKQKAGTDAAYRVVITCASSDEADAVRRMLSDAGHEAKKVKL